MGTTREYLGPLTTVRARVLNMLETDSFQHQSTL